MQSLSQHLSSTLDDNKAQEIAVLDVRKLTDVMDYMIVASGTSSRHVSSLASNLAASAKSQGYTLLGHEGLNLGEWALLDFGDVVVHVMHPATREYYQLEKLWAAPELLS